MKKTRSKKQIKKHSANIKDEVKSLTRRCEQLEKQKNNIQKYLDLAEVIIVELDTKGRIKTISGRGYEVLGYTSDELIGKDWFKICLPKDEYTKVISVYKELISGARESRQNQNYILSKDGSRRFIEWNNQILRDSDGRIIGTISSGIDITKKREMELALRNSETKYRNLFENMTTGFALHKIICDEQGKPVNYRYIEINPAFERLTGVKASDLLGKTILEVLPNTEKYWIETFGHVALTGEPTTYQNYSRELGRYYDTYVFSPEPNYFAVIFSDVTERKNSENEVAILAERLDLATRSAHLGIWDWDIINDTLTWDDRMFELYGVSRDGFLGAYDAWVNVVHPEDRAYTDKSIKSALENEKPYDLEFRVCWPDGSVRYIKANGQVVRDENGIPLRMIGTNYDITERILDQEKLRFLAHYDSLSSLPNRNLFMERLAHALARATRNGTQVVVFYLDLDRFKNINDTFGHEVGDKFLKIISNYVKNSVRESDTIARLGGDEFSIIIEDIDGLDEVVAIADKILNAASKPVKLDNLEFYVTTSIGISIFPRDASDANTLLKNADSAMYRAKEFGCNNYQFYNKKMSSSALERLTLEQDLRRALAQNELEVYYQPQVSLASGKVIAVEALLRWNHTSLGLVLPDKFISVAEETGLIVSIGNWVLEQSCHQILAWQNSNVPVVPISVNLSGRQFLDNTLSATIRHTLKETGVDPHLIEFEITEGVVMHNPESANITLSELSQNGIRIAIDDFGTGYSSLSKLKNFPIDTLKIDQSFVRDILDDANDASIVHAIVSMAHSMGLQVVAEGVESEEQLATLKDYGCDSIQGFVYSVPLPKSEISNLLLNSDFTSSL